MGNPRIANRSYRRQTVECTFARTWLPALPGQRWIIHRPATVATIALGTQETPTGLIATVQEERTLVVDDLFNSNPYAPPQVVSDPPIVVQLRARGGWHRAFLWVKSSTIIIAIGAAYFDIESIVFSGPFYGLLAILIGLFGYFQRDGWSMVVSVVSLAFVISIFLLINIKDWSPSDADGPVQKMMIAYAVIALPVTLLLSLTHLRDQMREI
jgi:hypothetical protein